MPPGEWQAGKGYKLTPLFPPRLVSPFGTIVEQGVLRFSGKKKKSPRVPGKWACFPGNLETSVSQMANQDPPGSKVIFHHWSAVPPGKWSSA